MSRTTLAACVLLAVGGCVEGPVTDAERAVLKEEARALAQRLEVGGGAEIAEGSRSGDRSYVGAGVVVRLAFGAEVDLDLYVTDPLLETVYFARHESRTGGVIVRDVRCDTPGARIEEVRFAEPWPGRYRVGVDFPRRCDGTTRPDPAPYAVTVHANGEIHRTSGIVDPERFEIVVLEFEVEGGDS
jgi:hypothetical protein